MVSKTLSCLAAVRIDNKLWCSNLNFNGIYVIDLANDNIEYKGRFEGYDDFAVGLHRFACEYKNKIIFFPQYSCSIDSYDLSGQFFRCEIESWKSKERGANFPKTAGVYEWKGNYYVFPRYPKMNVLVYNPEKNEIVEEIELPLANDLFSNNEVSMSFNCVQVGNNVYMPVLGTNHLVKFDLNARKENSIELPCSVNIKGAIGYGNNIFAIHCDNAIKLFDSEFKELIQSYECISKFEDRMTEFVFLDSVIMVMPSYLGTIKLIDTVKCQAVEIKVDMQDRKLDLGVISRWYHLERTIKYKDSILLLPIGLNRGMVIDTKSKMIKDFECLLPENSIPSINLGKDVNYEKRNCDLQDFLQTLTYNHC